MRRIAVITGSSGFIGKQLVQKLKSSDVVLRYIDDLDDVMDQKWIAKYGFLDGPYDFYHLAGKTGVERSWAHVQEFIESNVLITQKVLEFCRLTKSNLVHLGSASYSSSISNNSIDEKQELSCNNPYAISKKLAEELCRFYSCQFDLRIVVLRLFNPYGPGQSTQFLIPHLIKQAVSGGPIRVQNLETSRDYIYIDDVINSITMCKKLDRGFHVYNIGTGLSYKVSEVINLLQDLGGFSGCVISKDKLIVGQVYSSKANIELIRQELGWEPNVTLRDGLEQMLNSFTVEANQ